MSRQSRLSLSLLTTLVAGPVLGAPPTLVDFGPDVIPTAVSDDGGVVVGASWLEDAEGIFRWTPSGGLTVIGGVADGRPDVSADGRTIAGTIAAEHHEAAFWTEKEGWKPLSASELLPPPPGWSTAADAISANGQRLAGATTPPPHEVVWNRAFSFNPDTWEDRWSDYGFQELPMPGKGGGARATAISNDGRVQIGSAFDRGLPFFAVRWIDGRLQELRDGNGQRLGGESVVCNSDCNVIVGGGGGSSAVKPILAWRMLANTRSAPCYFNPISGPRLPALRYSAFGTSENGNVVVGGYFYDEVSPGGGIGRSVAKGFIWIGDAHGGTMHDLQVYLNGLGQSFLGEWLNVVVNGVSADGRYLVGGGDDAQGRLRGWRVDFGATPQATGPVVDRTTCPTSRLDPPQLNSLAAQAGRPQQAQHREQPFGEFRSRAGHRYVVEPRGTRIYGGTRKDRLVALVALGADHYFDPATRMRLTFLRDHAGLVAGMSAHRRGQPAKFWQRKDD